MGPAKSFFRGRSAAADAPAAPGALRLENKNISQVLGHLHSLIGGTSLDVRCAVKLQNQCRAIIGRAQVIDMDRNGESAILNCLGLSLRHVIDGGANVGKWTAAVLQNAPDATCMIFEPSRLAVAELKKLYGASPKVVIRPAAVGDSPAEMIFYEEAAQGETSSLVRKAASATATPSLVAITTLDCEMERIGWDVVDYLKIDAEGYDFHVLRGARRSFEQKRIALGQFAYGDAWMLSGSTLTGALEWLKGLGYESFLLKKGHLYIPRPDFYGEYFGYSNYIFCHSAAKPLINHLIAGTV